MYLDCAFFPFKQWSIENISAEVQYVPQFNHASRSSISLRILYPLKQYSSFLGLRCLKSSKEIPMEKAKGKYSSHIILCQLTSSCDPVESL